MIPLGSGVPSPIEQQISNYDKDLGYCNYFCSGEFWSKNGSQIGKFAAGMTAAYFLPGVVGYTAGRFLGYYKCAESMTLTGNHIVQISNSTWKAILIGKYGSGLIGTIVVTRATMELYHSLLSGDKTISYATWKINRLDIFRNTFMIPQDFQCDKVLKLNKCAILGVPVRYPVRTPFCEELFEEGAILAWVKSSGKCPITNENMEIEDLIYDNELSKQIEERISYLSEHPEVVKEQVKEAKDAALEIRRKLNLQQRERGNQLLNHTANQRQRAIDSLEAGDPEAANEAAEQYLALQTIQQ